tara:strand:- start:94 stop:672 length:579 start_codon:yes stop_codon:yes gene_type:complete
VSFKSLLCNVRACDICSSHLAHGTRPVIQVDRSAKILIAGQAPGRKVHESGIMFDDKSGDRLRDWMGIENDTFYDAKKIAILPMGFCYPGTGKSGDLPPRPECAPQWRERLLQQLPNIKLTLVIGQYAQAYHFPDNPHGNLTETVRAWRDYWPDALPLPHPSPRNNRWLRKNPWFEQDVLATLKKSTKKILS